MKSKFWYFIIGGLCLNVLLMAGIYLFSRLNTLPKQKIIPVTYLSNITYTQIENGIKTWELKAQEARMIENKKVALKEIKVTFFLKDGTPLYVKAKTGWLDLNTKDMELKGNVKLWQNNGFVFLSDYLKYMQARSVFFTESPVTLEGNGMQLMADGMKYFVNTKKWIFSPRVKTWLNEWLG